MIERKKSFTSRELLWFGPLFAAFAALLGWIALRKCNAPGVALGTGAVAAGVIVVYYLIPSLRRRIFGAWLALVFPLGWLLSHVILGIVFYLVVLPIGLALRLFGYDALRRCMDRKASTYWIERASSTRPERYFKQF